MEECYIAWDPTMGSYRLIHVGEGECIACRQCDILEMEIEDLEKESADA